MDFISIDVETANPDMASICQIGIARFLDGTLTDEWSTYVDPQDYFDPINVSIHKITESTIEGAPSFQEIWGKLSDYLDDQIVVTHTHFDRTAIYQAAQKWAISQPQCTWLDSARVARRAWNQFASRGYGLANVCKVLGYEFKHHDALEDAKAAGNIMLSAIEHSGVDLYGWLDKVKQPISMGDSTSPKSGRLKGNQQGPFIGEVIVFTGALEIPRRVASDMALDIGCKVDSGVTRKTTILVVGDQDVMRLIGHTKSSKHRQAEELILRGQQIRILKESDFHQLVTLNSESAQ